MTARRTVRRRLAQVREAVARRLVRVAARVATHSGSGLLLMQVKDAEIGVWPPEPDTDDVGDSYFFTLLGVCVAVRRRRDPCGELSGGSRRVELYVGVDDEREPGGEVLCVEVNQDGGQNYGDAGQGNLLRPTDG